MGSIDTLRITDRHRHQHTWNLFDQIRRATISVEANIVEGYALSTTPQLRRHLRIALASAAEAQTLLNAVTELEYLPNGPAETLRSHADKTIATLYALLRSPKLRTRNRP